MLPSFVVNQLSALLALRVNLLTAYVRSVNEITEEVRGRGRLNVMRGNKQTHKAFMG